MEHKSKNITTNNVYCIEGVSGIGKTCLSDFSLDFTKYIKYSRYTLKQSKAYMAALYESNIHVDLMRLLKFISANLGDQPQKFIDRSPFSSIVYNMIFECDGHIRDHKDFCNKFNECFDATYIHQVQTTIVKWLQEFKCLCYNIDFDVVYFSPKNYRRVARALAKRNLTDPFYLEVDPINYILNQDYAFRKIFKPLSPKYIKYIKLEDAFITVAELDKHNLLV